MFFSSFFSLLLTERHPEACDDDEDSADEAFTATSAQTAEIVEQLASKHRLQQAKRDFHTLQLLGSLKRPKFSRARTPEKAIQHLVDSAGGGDVVSSHPAVGGSESTE